MTDNEVVSFLQSRSQLLRNGEELTVVTAKGSERWRLISYPNFNVRNLFPTAYYAVSSRGRLLRNGGDITDSETCAVLTAKATRLWG